MSTAVGVRVPRSDGEAKVRGSADYGVDVVLPGMVHARLWRSPVRAGQVVSIDSSEAERVPGVLAVVSASQAPQHPTGAAIWDQPLFAGERIRYVGEPIAAVVGETMSAVDEALRRLRVDITELPAVTDPESALAPGAPLVHPDLSSYRTAGDTDWPRYGNVVCDMTSDPGGIDDIFATAEHVVEDEYRADRQYQAYLESRGAVAEYQAGRYVIHVSHQFPFSIRDRVAAALGVDQSCVRVIGHHIGGGFGAKLDSGLEPYAALLAKHVGRPVRMVNARPEDLITAPCRENAIVRIRSAVSADGEILAREMDVVFDSGAYGIDAPYLASIPLFAAGSPYRVGRARVRCRAVYTNTAPTGAFRGVSGTYLVFAVERHMDHIAQVLSRDRRELRVHNLMRDGDKLLNGQVLADASILAEAFDKAEGVASWSTLGQGENRGVGIAACVWLTNPLPGSAVLKLNEDGTLGLVTGATENGSGAVTMGLRQIAAEELGLDTSNVQVSMPDTDVNGYDAGSQGSRTTRVVGRAVRGAAEQVRKRVFETAAAMLEAGEADLELVDGSVGVKGDPSTRIPLAVIARSAAGKGGPITGSGSYTTPLPSYDKTCASGFLFPTFPTPTYHVHVAEVEVDPVTGNVTILRYIVVQEVGRVINPTGVAGQIQGGVTQGLGYALWEWLQLDGGTYQQQTLEAYGLPLAVDVPRVEIVTLEHNEPEGPYGAKGVAEPPVVPVAAAVGNAIADAVGKARAATAPTIDRIPVTPESVLRSLGRS
ncbi:MAG TPA: xanthine dehydrogenase family protein molybdopterin-binding subunit [Streptosporangiaceae bacterium]|nr:xanthine dehydrogenase family protein molybdopterin-binding subunit [Streptosporangiaceae bacterium]